MSRLPLLDIRSDDMCFGRHSAAQRQRHRTRHLFIQNSRSRLTRPSKNFLESNLHYTHPSSAIGNMINIYTEKGLRCKISTALAISAAPVNHPAPNFSSRCG